MATFTRRPLTSAWMIPARVSKESVSGAMPCMHRKPGGATAAVAAHLRLGAVGVVKAPAKIGLIRAFEEDQTVGPDAHLAVADPPGKPGLLGLRDESRPVVDEHEVVAPAVHFIKWNVLYL